MSATTLFPGTALENSVKRPVSVELRDGTTVNGELVRVDRWMNLAVRDVIRQDGDGETFHKARVIVIRGAAVRSVRVVDEALEGPKVPPRPFGVKKPRDGGQQLSKDERARKYGKTAGRGQ